jgi:hypothetical protein
MWSLIVVVLVVVIGGITVYGIEKILIPDGIIAFGTTALGALLYLAYVMLRDWSGRLFMRWQGRLQR